MLLPAVFPDQKQSFLFIIVLVTGVGAGGLLYFFSPADTGYFPSCPFYVLTGLYCPGCGSLRSMHSLLHGNLSGALAGNPLLILSLPLLVLISIIRKVRPELYFRFSVGYIMLAVIIMYWILRNIPFFPFTCLAPYTP